MTTIKTYCPACGEVDLTTDDVVLYLDPGADSFYAFDCPACLLAVRKHADERIVRMLQSAGVTCLTLPGARTTGAPAFTYDDLLDLHALLERHDWFDRLHSLVQH